MGPVFIELGWPSWSRMHQYLAMTKKIILENESTSFAGWTAPHIKRFEREFEGHGCRKTCEIRCSLLLYGATRISRSARERVLTLILRHVCAGLLADPALLRWHWCPYRSTRTRSSVQKASELQVADCAGHSCIHKSLGRFRPTIFQNLLEIVNL